MVWADSLLLKLKNKMLIATNKRNGSVIVFCIHSRLKKQCSFRDNKTVNFKGLISLFSKNGPDNKAGGYWFLLRRAGLSGGR